MPPALFVEELTTAYPEAKVILTNRDVDKWIVSYQSTVLKIASWWTWHWIAPYDPYRVGPFRAMIDVMLRAFSGTARTDYLSESHRELYKQRYMEHYEHVRRFVPKERLLEFSMGDGWEPLCAFLGNDVPAEEFPRVNDSKTHMRRMTLIWTGAAFRAAAKTILPAVVGLVAIYMFRRNLGMA